MPVTWPDVLPLLYHYCSIPKHGRISALAKGLESLNMSRQWRHIILAGAILYTVIRVIIRLIEFVFTELTQLLLRVQ